MFCNSFSGFLFLFLFVITDDSEKKRLKSLGVDSSASSSHPTGSSASGGSTSTDTKPPVGIDNSRVPPPSSDLKPDVSGDEMAACQVVSKSRTSITQPLSGSGGARLKSPSSTPSRTPNPIQISPQCQYPLPQSTSPYLQAGSPSCEQVYYPHHTPANSMAAMQMANSGLLQPVSTTSITSGLSLSGHMSQQMQACQLPGQNSACALAQASSSTQGSGYGLTGAGSSQGHSGLPSCTYMQNQTYPGHLPTTMSVMNMAATSHFSGPMA